MQPAFVSTTKKVLTVTGIVLALILIHAKWHQPRARVNPALNSARSIAATTAPKVQQSYAYLPLLFEKNEGQTDNRVQFLSRGPGYGLFLTRSEAVLSLRSSQMGASISGQKHVISRRATSFSRGQHEETQQALLRIRLAGASGTSKVSGVDQQSSSVNYFIGRNRSNWHTNVPTYAKIRYSDVYPGVDLVYYGNQRQLEYDWIVSPGADVHNIAVDISGVANAAARTNGDVVLNTAGGDVIQHAPTVYQELAGKRQYIPAKVVLDVLPYSQASASTSRMRFEVAQYDHSRPLIIDPVLVYSTFLGGSGYDSSAGIAVDSLGNAYIAGQTSSADFPLVSPIQSNNNANTESGYTNAFVSKINAAGTAIVYSTYLGGSKDDEALGVAVDSSGDAYVAGLAESSNFPIANALYKTIPGPSAGFISKLNPSGTSLLYSTFLGGSNGAEITAIAVDTAGDAYVTGGTGSTDFPTKNAVQQVNNGHGVLGDGNIFITEFNPTGSALVYSTYYGGSGGDVGNAIAVDSLGNTYVAGDANSSDFPVHNAFQGSPMGEGDCFVLKLTQNGLAVAFASYLGGSLIDHAHAIAVDSAGSAYVGGDTNSLNFPHINGYQISNHNPGGVSTGFLTKVSTSGGLVWSTYLGGSGDTVGNGESVDGVAVDTNSEAIVTGSSSSPNFPLVNPIQSTNGGGNAFITKFNAAGSNLVFSTFLGGTGGDVGLGIALDSLGNAYITGETRSTDFPTISPVQATTHTQLAANSFVTRINMNNSWQAMDISASSDGKARLLWYNQQGQMKLWSVAVGGAATQGPTYGPFAGYTVRTVANGSDGLTRVLWNATDGTAALWLMNSDNTLNSQFSFSPIVGWSVVDVTVGSDNLTRLLWANRNGSICLWTVNNAGGITKGPVYGPFAGWTPRGIAGGPTTDGFIRVTWNNNGEVAVWLMNLDNTVNAKQFFGPILGWSAIDVSAGIDNTTRLLWVNAAGQALVWSASDAGVVTKGPVFSPGTGWNATRISSGLDGYTRLLWFNNNGAQALWELNPNDSQFNSASFGPF